MESSLATPVPVFTEFALYASKAVYKKDSGKVLTEYEQVINQALDKSSITWGAWTEAIADFKSKNEDACQRYARQSYKIPFSMCKNMIKPMAEFATGSDPVVNEAITRTIKNLNAVILTGNAYYASRGVRAITCDVYDSPSTYSHSPRQQVVGAMFGVTPRTYSGSTMFLVSSWAAPVFNALAFKEFQEAPKETQKAVVELIYVLLHFLTCLTWSPIGCYESQKESDCFDIPHSKEGASTVLALSALLNMGYLKYVKKSRPALKVGFPGAMNAATAYYQARYVVETPEEDLDISGFLDYLNKIPYAFAGLPKAWEVGGNPAFFQKILKLKDTRLLENIVLNCFEYNIDERASANFVRWIKCDPPSAHNWEEALRQLNSIGVLIRPQDGELRKMYQAGALIRNAIECGVADRVSFKDDPVIQQIVDDIRKTTSSDMAGLGVLKAESFVEKINDKALQYTEKRLSFILEVAGLFDDLVVLTEPFLFAITDERLTSTVNRLIALDKNKERIAKLLNERVQTAAERRNEKFAIFGQKMTEAIIAQYAWSIENEDDFNLVALG